jgi:hypothetical protein
LDCRSFSVAGEGRTLNGLLDEVRNGIALRADADAQQDRRDDHAPYAVVSPRLEQARTEMPTFYFHVSFPLAVLYQIPAAPTNTNPRAVESALHGGANRPRQAVRILLMSPEFVF